MPTTLGSRTHCWAASAWAGRTQKTCPRDHSQVPALILTPQASVLPHQRLSQAARDDRHCPGPSAQLRPWGPRGSQRLQRSSPHGQTDPRVHGGGVLVQPLERVAHPRPTASRHPRSPHARQGSDQASCRVSPHRHWPRGTFSDLGQAGGRGHGPFAHVLSAGASVSGGLPCRDRGTPTAPAP